MSMKKTVYSLPSTASSPRGFTLLMAVLISSVLLSLGFAIFNIVSKELVLTSSGRESQFAFYAADSGIECALFWDYQNDAFSTSTPVQPQCAGALVENYATSYDPLSETYTTIFDFSLGGAQTDPCVRVTLERLDTPKRTTLTASGYNTCVTTNPRRIERAIRVQY
jgi:Tfp pilus assembly protein PilX